MRFCMLRGSIRAATRIFLREIQPRRLRSDGRLGAWRNLDSAPGVIDPIGAKQEIIETGDHP